MADRRRLRYDLFISSLNASLGAGATTITFLDTPPFKTLGANEMVVLSLDNTEVVHLTAYTSGNLTGTIERGQEGTSAIAHANGVPVVHTPTALDYRPSAAGFPMLASPDGTLWGLEVDDTDGSITTYTVTDTALGETHTDYADDFALVASDDSTWSVTVDNSGVLSTDQTSPVTAQYDYGRGPTISDTSGRLRRLGVATDGVLFAYG